jgi:lipopolysaccharide transport system ATP-binding protein
LQGYYISPFTFNISMSDTVIKVDNLSKKYILSHQSQERYTALRDVMARGVKNLGKKILSPFTIHHSQDSFTASQEEFYALNDVSFEIKQGDRVGIIGRNGAGKSTLLKILSRITEPTSGRIEITGRVASLLEVGTGFHPELTGRENIFLNGAILGMSKAEIKRRFDEIVTFAEIEKFLDTPVKRYSSGMYVRLAFAVAAHLEPEILIVDEVLAVGDVQFQKKCLGKMEEVGKDGRTVLFVSHNMGAIKQLCTKGLLLSGGNLLFQGNVNNAIEEYLENTNDKQHDVFKRAGNGKIRFENVYISDVNGSKKSDFFVGDTIKVEFILHYKHKIKNTIIGIDIKNVLNENFAHIINMDDNFVLEGIDANESVNLCVELPNINFTPSRYYISFWVGEDMQEPCDYLENCLILDLLQGEYIGRSIPYPAHVKVYLKSNWMRNIDENV